MPPIQSESVLLYTGELTIVVHRGKSLRDRTTFTTMKPYLRMSWRHHKFKSPAIEKGGTSPNFADFRADFHLETASQNELISISVWSEETLTDDECGRTSFKIKDLIARANTGSSVWLELRDESNFNKACGHIQCSFEWRDDVKLMRTQRQDSSSNDASTAAAAATDATSAAAVALSAFQHQRHASQTAAAAASISPSRDVSPPAAMTQVRSASIEYQQQQPLQHPFPAASHQHNLSLSQSSSNNHSMPTSPMSQTSTQFQPQQQMPIQQPQAHMRQLSTSSSHSTGGTYISPTPAVVHLHRPPPATVAVGQMSVPPQHQPPQQQQSHFQNVHLNTLQHSLSSFANTAQAVLQPYLSSTNQQPQQPQLQPHATVSPYQQTQQLQLQPYASTSNQSNGFQPTPVSSMHSTAQLQLQPHAHSRSQQQPMLMHQQQQHSLQQQSSFGHSQPFAMHPSTSPVITQFQQQPTTLFQQQPIASVASFQQLPPSMSPNSPTNIPVADRLTCTALKFASTPGVGECSDLGDLVKFGGPSAGLVLRRVEFFTDASNRLTGWCCHWLDTGNRTLSGAIHLAGINSHTSPCEVDVARGERFNSILCRTDAQGFIEQIRLRTTQMREFVVGPSESALAHPELRTVGAIKGFNASMRKGKFLEVGIIS